MITSILVPFLLAQTGGYYDDKGVVSIKTAGVGADGATFYSKAVFNDPDPNGDNMDAGQSGGFVDSTHTSVYVSVGATVDGFQGTAAMSIAPQFYFCGTFTGLQADLPTTISYSIPKSEASTARATTQVTASGSTSNSSASAPSGSGTPTFSNTVSGTLSGAAWTQQPDGSFTFNQSVFSNSLSTNVVSSAASRRVAGSATAKVTWSCTASASH